MKRRGERQVLFMALVLLGVTFSFARGFEGLAPVGALVGRAAAPVGELLRGMGIVGDRVAGGLGDAAALQQRVDELERQLAEMEVNWPKYGAVVRENEELRELLAFRDERVDLDLFGASVEGAAIGAEPGSLLHTVWIDVGQGEGALVDHPVVTSRGLAGRIVRVFPGSSQVRLISDPNARVGVRIERSGSTGVLVGSPSGTLTMRYIPQNQPGQEPNVEVGDLVFTSGLAGQTHYPKMLPVGQVVEVRQSDERTSQEAVVRPHVDMQSLEFVLVVTGWDPADGRRPGGEPAPEGGEG